MMIHNGEFCSPTRLAVALIFWPRPNL